MSSSSLFGKHKLLTAVPGRYWMYAAVRAGHQGLLISNDEMRDHIFQVPSSSRLQCLYCGASLLQWVMLSETVE